MRIAEQIKAGKLRCVRSATALRREGDALVSACGNHRYPMPGGVPLLLARPQEAQRWLDANPAMESEYRRPGIYHRLRKRLYRDYTSRAHDEAFSVIRALPEEALVLEIGGGPGRSGEHITALNIGPFPNVDIVGDTHDLPYMDDSVDAICHAAVLEHVCEPVRAVREMHRVLKPGGYLFSSIPFLQAYHGYPDHYQNYTLSGHRHLYASHGFEVIESGTAQGPIMTLTTISARFFLEYFPKPLNLVFGRSIQGLALLLRPLDRLLDGNPRQHVLASTTFVLARKPQAPAPGA